MFLRLLFLVLFKLFQRKRSTTACGRTKLMPQKRYR